MKCPYSSVNGMTAALRHASGGMSLESLFSAVSPQSTLSEDHPGPDALLNLALACKGMPDPHWHALLWRYLRDDGARGYLYQQARYRSPYSHALRRSASVPDHWPG